MRLKEGKSDGPRGNWNYPTTVRFGAGRASELASREGGRFPQPAIRHRSLVAKMPMTQAAIEVLAAAGTPAKLFSDVSPIRSRPTSRKVCGLQGGRHDGLVAFGAALRSMPATDRADARQTRSVFDFEDVGDR